MSDFDKSMAHEALDRIHVCQTLIAEILVDVESHPGLCLAAKKMIEQAQENLAAAYQEQGVCLE